MEENRGIEREIEIALQVLDAVVPDGMGSYLAGPISTGLRYFECLSRYGVRELKGLINAIGEDKYLQLVRWPNVNDGERVANDLRSRGISYLINTGPIFVRGWCGHDYMEFCLKLLEKKVHTVYFHNEWVFSHGAIKEFVFCRSRGLLTLDLSCNQISDRDAFVSLNNAKLRLANIGLPTERIDALIDQLR